jgi:hypothetical protein
MTYVRNDTRGSLKSHLKRLLSFSESNSGFCALLDVAWRHWGCSFDWDRFGLLRFWSHPSTVCKGPPCFLQERKTRNFGRGSLVPITSPDFNFPSNFCKPLLQSASRRNPTGQGFPAASPVQTIRTSATAARDPACGRIGALGFPVPGYRCYGPVNFSLLDPT